MDSAGGTRIPPLDVAQRLHELETLYESLRTISSTLDLGDLVRKVLDAIRSVTDAQALSLLLYDAEREELVFAASEMLSTETLAGGRRSDLPPQGNPLSVRLQSAAGEVGLVELSDRIDHRPFDDADRERLEAIAPTLADSLHPETIAHDAAALEAAFARIAVAVPSVAATLVLRDDEGRELAFTSSHIIHAGGVDGVRLRLDQGIAGWVARHREAVCLENASTDPRHDPTLARKTGFVPRSMICVPLVHQDTLLGVLQVINKRGGASFTGDEMRLVQTLGAQAASAIAHAQLYRQVQIASLTDDLTGLGNTRRFNAELPAILARGGEVSLLVLDLDELKGIVDRHGHLVGSRAIATVGRLIAGCLRPGDSAARFGGDEFVVVLPSTPAGAAAGVAEAIRDAVARCARPDGMDVDISALTASIGVATYPIHATSPDRLFRVADRAMYRIKNGGKNGVAVAPA
ncbi:MAG TPA: sensor domain-containing diguanylate cyclase [Candidatus Binatia bacterium]